MTRIRLFGIWASPIEEIFLFKIFFLIFERASRAFCQHLTCHIWKDNEILVIAGSFKEKLNF